MGEGLKEPEVVRLDIELGKDGLPQGSHDVQMNCRGKSSRQLPVGEQVQERQLGLTQHLCKIPTCWAAREVCSPALTESSPSLGHRPLELRQRED